MTKLPIFPEGVNCGTCRHWSASDTNWIGFFRCRVIGEESTTMDAPGAVTTDRNLMPNKHFACNLWEPKE